MLTVERQELPAIPKDGTKSGHNLDMLIGTAILKAPDHGTDLQADLEELFVL
jgi:hypothetical protein